VNTTQRMAVTLVSALTLAGCSVNLDVLPEGLIATGSPFVVSGTSILLENQGPCPAWVADNGITYHLFQSSRVDNDLFDRITTAGVRSRLEIAVRTDLELTCRIGPIVEVRNVLEIVD
jgi:hypothetical protein